MSFKRILILCSLLGVLCVTFQVSSAPSNVDTGSISGYKTTTSTQFGSGTDFYVALADSELKEALRFLAKVSGLNIMIPEDLTGVVNVSFDNVDIMDAINSIVRANDLDYAIERGILRVGKTGQFTNTGEDLKTETIRLSYATAKDLTEKVKTLLTERGSVLSDERTNSLVIRERLANIDSVRRFIKDIDIRDAQVLIEARIVEATRDFARDIGIQWGINTAANRVNVVGVNAVGQSDANRNLNVNLPADNPTSGIGLLIGTLAGGTNIDVAITAAEQKGDARIISEPSIVTSNGVPANIRSGETLLIKTTGDLNIGAATVPGDTGLHQIDTGVKLTVTPQISGQTYVKLSIEAETSQPDFTREVENIPVIVDNTASTEVLVVDGQTTVIGGLAKFSGSDTVKRVPFLSSIPLLGNLFKSKAKQMRNTELMIFIRPLILKPLENFEMDNALYEDSEAEKEKTIVTPLDKKKEAKRTERLEDEGGDTRAISRNPHLQYRYNR